MEGIFSGGFLIMRRHVKDRNIRPYDGKTFVLQIRGVIE
jgi:hypothetical protein